MLRYRTTTIFSISHRMLSTSSSLNPNLLLAMKTTSPSSKLPHIQPCSNPKNFPSFSNNSPHNLTLPKCFSAITGPDPIASQTHITNPQIESDLENLQSLVVVSFYKFADFPDHADFRKPLKDLCEELRVSGGIILAPEGINGSICGNPQAVEKVLEFIQSDYRLKGLRQVECPVSPEEEAIHHGHSNNSPLASGEDTPFRWDHVRVKLKKEIVSLGMPTVSPIERVGKYVNPKEWNALITDPDTVVIDVRNGYETRIGKFKGAVDPCTTAFRKFPSWVEDKFQVSEADDHINANSDTNEEIQEQKMPPKVAMYCTGGIRCEKASSYLLSKGFKEVYHLEGGILKYLEEVPKKESLWEGECFVFDKRVSVDHGLEPGTFKLCYGCKQPVSDADMEAPEWEYAVSCPYCYASKSEAERDRARARQRQVETWGVIGGPDKGRRPTFKSDGTKKECAAVEFCLDTGKV